MSAATQKQKPINLLLIARHALLRESIGRLLSSEPDFRVAAECTTATQASEILKHQPIDVVLFDFDPGEREAGEFIHAARTLGFKCKLLLLAGESSRGNEAELMRAGIYGIFHKGDSATSLGHAIKDVAAGNVWFRREYLQRALTRGADSVSQSPDELTQRERRVLYLVSDGLKNREIGAEIGVSEGSVKSTLQQLFSKFGVRSRSQLVRIALEQHKPQL